jgi:hypothetical protein
LNTAKKTVALVHKTWLAGIGAYDSGREKATDKFDQLFVDGSAFVNDLLEKGESVETQLQSKIEARKMLKDKISALKAKLSFGNDSRDQQIDMLSQRVDNLIGVVAKLAQQKAVEKKATTTAPANTATKASATKAAKPAVAKPAVAKPAVAKPAVAKPAVAKPAVAKPAVAKPAVAKPAVAKPAVAKPAVAKPAVAKPAAAKPAAAKPAVAKPAVAKPASQPKSDDKD